MYLVNFSMLMSLFSLSTLPRACLGHTFCLVFLSFVTPPSAWPHSLAPPHALGRSRQTRAHRRPHAQTRTSVLGPPPHSLLLSKPQCTPRASQRSLRTLREAPFGTIWSETWLPLSTTYSVTCSVLDSGCCPPHPREDPGSLLQNDSFDLVWPGAPQAPLTCLLSIISSLVLFAFHVGPFFLLFINTYLQTS